ncbi:fumarylacetoacetate hydrolase family protein [Streptomyces sp. NPDC048717]|uniref:2-keto-4-pentenoate hydratase n=1 Tax=Streptomyces sp. NPDC048717 TaxID=3154928 RepID=UPI00342DCF5E
MSVRSRGSAAPLPGVPRRRPVDGRLVNRPPVPLDLPHLGAALAGHGYLTAPGTDGEVPPWIGREALALFHAERAAVSVDALTARRPDVDLADAYQIQRTGTAFRIAAGARPIGHKVGLTSEAMRQQMGIDDPDSGILLDYMAVPSGGTVDTTALVSPLVETEFAFRLGKDLAGADIAAARAAVSEVMVALEVIDTRYRGQQLTLADSIADNAACARIVTGPAVPFCSGLDLPERLLTLRIGGTPAASGMGREVLGDPLAAIAWLARRLAAFGTGLRAGDIVLAGSVHRAVPLRPGMLLEADCDALPPVTARAI